MLYSLAGFFGVFRLWITCGALGGNAEEVFELNSRSRANIFSSAFNGACMLSKERRKVTATSVQYADENLFEMTHACGLKRRCGGFVPQLRRVKVACPEGRIVNDL